MTGIERLREFVDGVSPITVVCGVTKIAYDRGHVKEAGVRLRDFLADIADQIEREHNVADREEHDAATWVREHGGLEHLKNSLSALELLAEGIEIDAGLAFYDESPKERCVALRNEVKSRLMPEGVEWPRFEDGEPVRIGDEVKAHTCCITVEAIEFSRGKVCVKDAEDGDWSTSCLAMHPIKRPAPKVLDADGAEIREKRDAWWICEGDERGIHAERLRVETILPDGLVECSPYNGGTWVSLEPSELYVNKPVPASDGRPLREGDTVWDVDGRGPLTVWRLPDKSDMYVSLKKDGTFYYRYPEKLTHEYPDSWERLEEDCAKSDVDYCAERGLLDPSCDAVEGDESSRHCTDCGCTCGEKMARDIVRRAKALAERGK